MRRLALAALAGLTLIAGTMTPLGAGATTARRPLQWSEVSDANPWAARAGLQVVELHGRFYLMGGRTPTPPGPQAVPGASTIWGDVWSSDDRGKTWQPLLDTETPGHWAARAYFSAVTKDDAMFVLGGQDFNVVPNQCPPMVPQCPPFVSKSTFFSDVWRSTDGVNWTQTTADAGWAGRAGLSSVVLGDDIYVFGGSKNDDSSIVGGPPQRIYYNDVWKSHDGVTWQMLTDHAPWAARAGAATVVKDGWIYLLGGEYGFTCSPLPGCTPPYYNDVWRSRNGVDWQPVTAAAGWSPRPGHKCVIGALDTIVCFGGIGLLSNPVDVWASWDGAHWKQLPSSPWNAVDPSEIKYDFAAVSVPGGPFGLLPTIYTFGGDRETFDFTDPLNSQRVDNDVWRFGPGAKTRW